MCGIGGVVEWTGRMIDPALPARFCRALRHRGPDDEGIHLQQAPSGRSAASVALAHTRLSIIDLAGGRQPMSSPDGAVWIVFNGEIYNYRELRAGLEQGGCRFRTQSDTEVILQSYLRSGEACVAVLEGMFAFAIWDGGHQRLLLARDRLGKKPLVYARQGSRCVFASELQALAQDAELALEPNWDALHHYLTLSCIPAPQTVFENVWKLPPAHYAVVEAGRMRLERYWTADPAAKRRVTTRQAVAELRERLTDAVRARLISDVPVGAFLSGGIDSSIVVSTMARLSDGPIDTFAIGFDEAPFNELPYARLVAERYGTRHTEFMVRPDAAAIMPQLLRHYGEPFADSSAIPTYYVSSCARQHVKVVLSGDGGDELFGGYYRHLAMRWADRYARLPRLVRDAVAGPLLRRWPAWLDARGGRLSVRRFARGLDRSRRDRALSWILAFGETEKRALYHADGPLSASSADTAACFDALWEPVAGSDGVDALAWVDLQWYLPSDLLVKMDIASMAHGLEVRAPWLDRRVVELALQLPAHLKVRGRTLKYLPRRAWQQDLPPAILRRGKQGFAVPLAAWLRGSLRDWMQELLLSPSAKSRGLLDPAAVTQLVEEHAAGGIDRSEQLWVLMMLELWFRVFADVRSDARVAG